MGTINQVMGYALVLLLLEACATPEPGPTTFSSPLLPETASLPSSTLPFLVAQVGQSYYGEHYELIHEEAVGEDLVKATYHYTYEPHVRDYVFTVFFEPQTQTLSGQEISIVLLQPQAFRISSDEAITLALEHGLAPAGEAPQVHLVLGPATGKRFAWEVTNPSVTPRAEAPEPVLQVVLDVESGAVYATAVEAPMEGH